MSELDSDRVGGATHGVISTGARVLSLPGVPCTAAGTGSAPRQTDTTASAELLARIGAVVRATTGWDITAYRSGTLLRRLQRQMHALNVRDEADYLRMLERRPDEVRALADHLLVPVTSFFRDTSVFEHIERIVVPRIFDRLGPGDCVRAWSVGCATGEEAYSISILLHEEAARRDWRTAIRVFATDLHQPSLVRARSGVYPQTIAAHVSEERLARFFQETPSGYRIHPMIRDSVVFTPHDLLGDPPFSRVDLVACRNLFIYLRPELQRKASEILHYALVPGGDLVLGKSESLEADGLFRASAPLLRCVCRKLDAKAGRLPLPEPARVLPCRPQRLLRPETPLDHSVLHERMILRAAPASVLVSPGDHIVYISAGADRYLAHPIGPPTTSVHARVRGELLPLLPVLLSSARAGAGAIRSQPVTIGTGAERVRVVLHAQASDNEAERGYVLLAFEDQPVERPDASAHADPNGQRAPDDREARIRKLELEITAGRSTIRALIEDYRAGQENLKASNWELQSANEELRATLEELESRKEELQRANERLEAVGNDNARKVVELGRLSQDLEHFFEATEIATLFVDRELRILRFTPAFARIFNVAPSDRGRHLGGFTHTLVDLELEQDAAAVVDRLVPVEREVQDRSGRCHLLRLVPYRSAPDRIDGAVITLVDISDRKRAEQIARESQEQRYRSLFQSIDQAFCVVEVIWDDCGDAVDHTLVEVNSAFQDLTGIRDAVGRRIRDIMPALEEHWFRTLGHVARAGEAVRFAARARELGRAFDIHAFRVDGPEASRVAVLLQDVTERHRIEEDLRSAATELSDANRRKDEYLAMLGHELRNPLAAIRSAAELLRLHDAHDARLGRARQVLERQSTHMARLIDGLLEVSRLARGKVHVERTKLDLRVVLEAVLEDRAPQLLARGLTLHTALARAPAWVNGDPIRLAQVFDNLLGNAIKFTRPSGRVCVSLGIEGSEAVVRVRDTGVGIRPEMLARVFEPFQQDTQDFARSAGGLGLGLALAQGLVELHDGQIVARSEGLDKGAELEVRLALAEPPVETCRQSRTEAAPPCRILLVEDNADAAQMLRDLLELCGHTLTLADTGTKALEHLQATAYDIVLCDLGLPGMSGLELARAVRERADLRTIPLVALTGYGQEEDRVQSADAGFDEHLVKPVDLAVLDVVIARLVARVRPQGTQQSVEGSVGVAAPIGFPPEPAQLSTVSCTAVNASPIGTANGSQCAMSVGHTTDGAPLQSAPSRSSMRHTGPCTLHAQAEQSRPSR